MLDQLPELDARRKRRGSSLDADVVLFSLELSAPRNGFIAAQIYRSALAICEPSATRRLSLAQHELAPTRLRRPPARAEYFFAAHPCPAASRSEATAQDVPLCR